MLNPFAYTGRVDCKVCKDNRNKGDCKSCKNKPYITICLICENPYPKGCSCYDWMYDEQWYWDKINK